MGLKDRLWTGTLGAARVAGAFTRGVVDGGRHAVRLLARDARGRLMVHTASGKARRTLAELVGDARGSRSAADVAAGVAIAAGLAVGESIYAHPGVQATLRATDRDLRGLDPEHHDGAEQAAPMAEAVVRELERRGVRPLRLAVDGLPGSGKTTLARELARRLGLEHFSLEHVDMTRPQPGLARPGIVAEHHRLLRTQELDGFDALVYLDLPVAEIRRRVQRRERGGYLLALFDFERMKRIGDLAFRACAGEEVDVGGGALLKIRPPGGYAVARRLEAVARARGLSGSASLSREEALFLVASGRAREGLRAYLNGGELRRELAAAAAAALGVLARRE